MPSAAAKLREMLAEKGRTIVSPGIYDGLGARICLSKGFDTLYMVSLVATKSLWRLSWGHSQVSRRRQAL